MASSDDSSSEGSVLSSSNNSSDEDQNSSKQGSSKSSQDKAQQEKLKQAKLAKKRRKEQNIFYEEMMDLFKEGMNREEVFSNTVTEIDQLRKTYNQNTSDVMQSVMKGLLMLPTKCATADKFFDQLPPILKKFQMLLTHFAKWRDAYQNYLIGVKDALRLLIGQKVITKRGNIVKLLSIITNETELEFPSIIADIHQGNYGESEKEEIDFTEIPVGNVSPALGEPSFTETVEPNRTTLLISTQQQTTAVPASASGVTTVPTPRSCKGTESHVIEINGEMIVRHNKEHKFNSKTFSKSFTTLGGTFKHWTTDDCVNIPEGAIPPDDEWVIQGEVVTSVDEYASMLPHEHERFVSTIMDYAVVINGEKAKHKNFRKPVTIIVHHTARSTKIKDIRVLCLDDDNNTIEVPKRHKDLSKTNKDFNCIIFDDYVKIFTVHFSKYVVAATTPNGIPVEQNIIGIDVLVYGKIHTDSSKRNPYRVMLETYLWINMENNAQTLPGYIENFKRNMSEQGMKQLVWKPLILPPVLEPDYDLVVNLKLGKDFETNWCVDDDLGDELGPQTHRLRNFFPETTVTLSPVVTLGSFALRGNDPSIEAALRLEFVFEKNGQRPTKAIFRLEATDKTTEKMMLPGLQGPLSDEALYDLAAKVSATKWYQLGLKLGHFANELDNIEHNFGKHDIQRAIFQMFRLWRDKLPRDETQLKDGAKQLLSALEATTNAEAAKSLKINLPQQDDSHKDFPASEKNENDKSVY